MNKKCFVCLQDKPLSSFYKHKKMKDGHLNKCIECTKQGVKERRLINLQNSDWVKKEAERQRIKERKRYLLKKSQGVIIRVNRSNHALNFPEKIIARSVASVLPCSEGFHRHHWSYLEQYYTDVIILPIQDHYLVHRHLIYDNKCKCYKDEDGNLLDTKIKHLDFILKLIHSNEISI